MERIKKARYRCVEHCPECEEHCPECEEHCTFTFLSGEKPQLEKECPVGGFPKLVLMYEYLEDDR